jgi:carboxypeptidase T
MKKLILVSFSLLLAFSLTAQQMERYQRVRVDLRGQDVAKLAGLGVETDHGVYEPGRSLTTELSLSEHQTVLTAGFRTEVLIDDLSEWYRLQLAAPPVKARGNDCDSGSPLGPVYSTPANYTDGSMGGYHTLDEMLAILDDMRAKFPNLISVRDSISDTVHTHEGRPVWYVRLSDNADADEGEPEVLYTALHHAREPNGLSQMLYYMWYLLENYDSDPSVRYILDNSALYFVPCVNPDGYEFNRMNNPDGGGMWRKNRRNNQDGTYGVDLNRNYGYEWAHDNNGSSPNPGSEVYRGPAAFSEPETRMLRDFCLSHSFRIAFNYHTFSNLLIYPWSYSDTPADPGFVELGRLFTRENNYRTGTSIETVGYRVNGNSDDWMFGGSDIFAFTPEVGPGSYGFWPPQSAIEGLNNENVWANISAALCGLQYAEARDGDNGSFSLIDPNLAVRVIRYGFEDGPFTISLTPLSPAVASVSAPITVDIPQFATLDTAFQISFSPTAQSGDEAIFLLELNNGSITFTDTLRKILYGPFEPILTETGDNLDNWSTAGWSLTTEQFVSAPSSITDSPGSDYSGNSVTGIESAPLQVPANALHARLRFWARWQIEPRYDYVVLQAITANGSEVNLCGLYTKPGTNNQLAGEPIYDGLQADWVEECVDLEPFAGTSIALRFLLVSDGFLEYDGFYFDDLVVEYTLDGYVGSVALNPADFRLLPAQPNPASGRTTFSWENPGERVEGPAYLVIADALGRALLRERVDLNRQQQHAVHLGALQAGVYFYYLEGEQWRSAPGKISVVHRP